MSNVKQYAEFIAEQQRQLRSAGLIQQESDLNESKILTIIPPKGKGNRSDVQKIGDHRMSIEKIHSSIQNHPETRGMLTKNVSGNSTQGFITVRKKSDVEKVKAHIKKYHPGVKIVDNNPSNEKEEMQ